MNTNPCLGCGCCCSYEISVYPDTDIKVPLDMCEQSRDKMLLVFSSGISMKIQEDGYCVAFDKEKRCCTIYENRPRVCKQFKMGCGDCHWVIKQRTDELNAKNMRMKIKEYKQSRKVSKQ